MDKLATDLANMATYLRWIADQDRAVKEASAELTRVVVATREKGASWSEIGDALGCTKQAAWERYSRLL